jgi:hypothetical protein
MLDAFATKPNLRTASRLPTLAGEAGVTAAEVACLFACGAAAALAVGLIHYSFGIPGIAILRGVLPIAFGFAIVPRRSAGITMSMGAGATAAVMNAAHLGEFQIPAMVGTLAFGPVLDFVLAGRPQGWRIYLRFGVAGATANLLAFSAKFVSAYFGWHFPGSGRVTHFWSLSLGSFILCGALAGIISAVIWFRARVADDLRRN